MKTLITLITMTSLMLLGSCGGSSPDLIEGEDPQVHQEITTPEQPTPDPVASYPIESDPVIGAEPPEGAALVGLKRGTVDSVQLPAMDPGLLVPEDIQLPQLWLFNFSQGATVHDTVYLSVLSVDDSDTNLIALLIDRELVKVCETSVLELVWDTTQLADGEHELIYVVRDNGNNMGLCTLWVEVDNTTDWGPPKVTIGSVTSRYDGLVFETTESPHYYHHPSWYVVGQVEFTVKAKDASGIKRLDLFTREHGGDVYSRCRDMTPEAWGASELLGQSDQGEIAVRFDTADWESNRFFLAVAEDSKGEVTEWCFQPVPRYTTWMHARFTTLSSVEANGVEVFVMPLGWMASEGLDPELAISYDVGNKYGWVICGDIPVGRHMLVAIFEGHKPIVIKHNFGPGSKNAPPYEHSVFVPLD